jgi:hypothetical protein
MIHRTRVDAKPNTWSQRLISPFLVLPALAVGLSACVGSLLSGSEDTATPVSYHAYFSRGGSEDAEFEQYRSVPSGVFIECGSYVRGKPQPKEQGIARVSAEQEALIVDKAREVVEASDDNAMFTLDPPAGANQVRLSLKIDGHVTDIRTSLDSLAQSEAENAVALRELLEAVRGVLSPPLCGRKAFAQIGRLVP